MTKQQEQEQINKLIFAEIEKFKLNQEKLHNIFKTGGKNEQPKKNS